MNRNKTQKYSCFSENSIAFTNEIKRLIINEIKDSIYYFFLSHKSPAKFTRTLRKISLQKNDNARRLYSALYLICGERYFPVTADMIPVCMPPYKNALKKLYQSETNGMYIYHDFANRIKDDIYLERLMLEIAKSKERHAKKIYRILSIIA